VAAKVWLNTFLLSTINVAVNPFTDNITLYQVSFLMLPGKLACFSTCQPAAVRMPISSLLVETFRPANLKLFASW
jgi:hypothetical protein